MTNTALSDDMLQTPAAGESHILPSATGKAPTTVASRRLICLPSMEGAQRALLIARLNASVNSGLLLIATPDELPDAHTPEVISYTPDSPQRLNWVLSAGEYRSAATLLEQHGCTSVILLGEDAASLPDKCLRALLESAQRADAALTLPRYELGPREGLVNSAILHPLTSALYGVPARFPLPLDVVLSAPMAARMAAAATRSSRTPDALLWPVTEAVAAGMAVREVACGPRVVPVPDPSQDLSVLLNTVVGSLFADLEAKAAVWQRARARLPAVASSAPPPQPLHVPEEDIQPLVAGFGNAYTNLHDLWALILPPQSLLGLKKLAASDASAFHMADELWVRIVYDFLLAYRLRTINQAHLLGAFTPLYLAWVASHLRQAGDAAHAEWHIAQLTEAFQRDKPYLLARWRWPDSFNP